MLENLLRPENSVTVLSGWEDHNSNWNAMQLLELTVKMEPETRVILDVGAQIIDISRNNVFNLNQTPEGEVIRFVPSSLRICISPLNLREDYPPTSHNLPLHQPELRGIPEGSS